MASLSLQKLGQGPSGPSAWWGWVSVALVFQTLHREAALALAPSASGRKPGEARLSIPAPSLSSGALQFLVASKSTEVGTRRFFEKYLRVLSSKSDLPSSSAPSSESHVETIFDTKRRGAAIKYMSGETTGDREICTAAVAQDGEALANYWTYHQLTSP